MTARNLIAFLVFLLLGITSEAQTDYYLSAKFVTTQYTSSGAVVDTFVLLSNAEKSIYQSSNNPTSNSPSMKESYDNEGSTIYTFSEPLGDTIHRQYFIDHSKSILVSREKYSHTGSDFEYFIIEEALEKLTWSLTQESKVIGGHNCIKALTRFRGRDYIAWFAPSIASNTGPWKFHGLPGMILDVREANNHCRMQCISYQWINGPIQIQKPDNGTKISMPEYITMRDKSAEAFILSILSKMPEGAQISNKSIQNNNLEIEFNY